MKYTSSEAAKLLRSLNDEYTKMLERERQCSLFVVSLGEDAESIRPSYDYQAVQEKLAELERKIRIVKHAINQFNVTCVVPETGMTIDQILVYIPQLSSRKNKLDLMMKRLPKQRYRDNFRTSTIVEYEYANYDIEKAEEDYKAVSAELSRVQTALDVLNNTLTMEIDV